MIERVLSSTVLGLVLGWLCWTSKSVLPGMALHALNNGLLLSLAYWGDGLKSLGLDVEDQRHLPPVWLAGAAGLTGIALALTYLGHRHDVLLDIPTGPPVEPSVPTPAEPNAG